VNNIRTQYTRRSNAYVILCYARMMAHWKGREWFTDKDYHTFQAGRIQTKRIRETLKRLVQQNFLTKDNTNPKTPRYHITEKGIGAIYDVERRYPSQEINKDIYRPVPKQQKPKAPAVIK
jgi:DNA-binding HxlR family transcriptional regulator